MLTILLALATGAGATQLVKVTVLPDWVRRVIDPDEQVSKRGTIAATPRSANPPHGSVTATPATSTQRGYTYADLCHGGVTPGEPAPAAQAAALRSLWLGGGTVAGSGALVAGCAEPAGPLSPGSQSWLARGMCGTELRSLGVATPGMPPAMLFQEVARFAWAKARSGVLTGAAPRVRAANGDFQIIYTTDGPYVLSRRVAAAGPVSPASSGPPCARLSSVNVRYTRVPPGLIDPWARAMDGGWLWPAQVASAHGYQRFVLIADDRDRVVATARCKTDQVCVVRIGARRLVTTTVDADAAQALVRIAPAPRG
jgi:hypothetical protein